MVFFHLIPSGGLVLIGRPFFVSILYTLKEKIFIEKFGKYLEVWWSFYYLYGIIKNKKKDQDYATLQF